MPFDVSSYTKKKKKRRRKSNKQKQMKTNEDAREETNETQFIKYKNILFQIQNNLITLRYFICIWKWNRHMS